MSNLSKSAEARHPSRKEKRHNGAKRNVVCPDKDLADRLRAVAVEKEIIKRSTLGLYSLKTQESSFGVPFCALSDQLALVAAKQLLPLANLYRVGSFCLYDGKISALNRPVLVLDNKVVENEKV